jgi:hypothetical protein
LLTLLHEIPLPPYKSRLLTEFDETLICERLRRIFAPYSAYRLLWAAPEGRKDSRGRKPPVQAKNRKSPGRGERLLFA